MPVSFKGWVRDFQENWDESKSIAVMQALYCIYLGAWFTVTSRRDPGENVLNGNWNLLIILDACRVDALREVASEYDWMDETEIKSTISLGSGSFEWMVKTFTTDHMDAISETTYVSTNAFVKKAFVDNIYAPSVSIPYGWPKANVVDESDFLDIRMLWQNYHDEQLGNVPPEAATKEAIHVGRSESPARCIVHYAQPHIPYLGRAIKEERPTNDIERSPLKSLKGGKISRDEAWELYLENLRVTLDEVEVLLENYDADRVLITADHGESLGEFGVHGHPTGWIHPVVKRVPWLWVSAEDNNTVDPEIKDTESSEEVDLEQRLRDLGYKT